MANARNLYADKKVAVIDFFIVLAFILILVYTNHNLKASASNSPTPQSSTASNHPNAAKSNSEDYKKYLLEGLIKAHN